jgi:genome maintenance exonuclease 1|tara:strand:+ start:29 stop:715 length:687 start_codon:yes stop_codon:yes gene_type:complete
MRNFTHVNDFYDAVEDYAERQTVDGNRVYVTPNGNSYPSITSILSRQPKTGIDEWRKKVGEEEANKIMKESAALGTMVHNLCEQYLYNMPLAESPEEVVSVFNRLRFILGNVDNIYGLELPLYSDILKVAGTADCVAEYNGVLSVIDFKTSRKAKREEWIEDYFIQAFFYAAAFYEMTGAVPEQIVILVAVRESFEIQVFKKPIADLEIYIDKLLKIMKKYPTVCQQY